METKVVLITGCSSGIGKALSEEFHRRDCRVVATARNQDSVADLQAKGMSTHTLDVTNTDDINRVVKAVSDQEKRIDILINNAGYALIGPCVEIPEPELALQFQTNVFSPLILAQKVASVMKQQGTGLILNIGSISGLATTPFSGAYCASKAALHALSDALRMELAPFGISVMTVQPGSIKSGFGKAANSTVSRVLKPGSWYSSLENAIRARAEISQADATPADEFARKLADAAMTGKPPAIVRTGKKSLILPLMKNLLPVNIYEGILRKKFGLTQKM
ncbi:MAG: SDR family oxidoreductase [Desulfobacterales bacterium]|nr:SDR family oxidoreductase [Desulfobacterales bacterium]